MFGHKKGIVFYMIEEQESIRSIVIEFIIVMVIFLGIFLSIEMFPFLTLPIFIIACVVIIFKAWKVWKIIKDLKRKN